MRSVEVPWSSSAQYESMAQDPLAEDLRQLGIYESMPQTELSPRKVRAYIYTTNWFWLLNHLGTYLIIPWTRRQLVELVSAITGWDTNLWELLKASERGLTMARAFNLREGLTRADGRLPPRMNTPFVSGSLNEQPIDPRILSENLTTFNGMMGWDPQTGVPTLARLQELDVEWVADHLPQGLVGQGSEGARRVSHRPSW